MGQFALRTRSWGNTDQRWIGRGGIPRSPVRSVVLDLSAFDTTTLYPNGVLPSGIALAKITATGIYGPYSVTDEVQTVTEGGSGLTSFTLTYSGQTTGSIAAAATAATVQAALVALSNVGAGNIAVTGAAGGPYTVSFRGTLADTNVAAMTATPTGGTGTVTIATTTAGGTEGAGGLDVFKGHLFTTVAYSDNQLDDSTGDLFGALFWDGVVVETYLPVGGTVDTNGKADMPTIQYVTDVVG